MSFRAYIYLIITILTTSIAWGAENFSAKLNAVKVIAGEPIWLEVSAKAGKPYIVQFPTVANLKLISASPQRTGMQSYNSDVTFTGSFALIPSGVGSYTIPPITISAGDESFQTPTLSFEVVDAAKQSVNSGGITLAEATFGEIKLAGERTKFYIGEEVPLTIEVYIMDGVNAELRSYPELQLPNVIFRDYSSVNRSSSRFAVPHSPELDVVNGRQYQRITFDSAFRSLAPDSFDIEANYRIAIAQPRNRSRRSGVFDDDFFDSFMGNSSMKVYNIKCSNTPKVSFIPLPTPPEGVDFIGAIGSGKLEFDFDVKSNIAVGDLANLKLTLEGNYNQESLKMPKLSLDAMRVYPPEITTHATTTTINYAIVPLRPGANSLELKLATFDPKTEKYKLFAFSKEFEVKPSERALGSISTQAPEQESSDQNIQTEKKSSMQLHEIFYLKPNSFNTKLSNSWAVALFVLGPILWLCFWWRRKIVLKRTASLSYQRTLDAKRRRSGVVAKLQQATTSEELTQIIGEDVVPLLNDALDLPRGSTGADIANIVENREFKSILEASSQSSFMPGVSGGKVSLEQRSVVIHALKRLLLLFLCLFSLCASANSRFDDGVNFYDKGDFVKAVEAFNGIETGSSALYYNRGLCYFMMQNYPNALLWLERAHRIAPRDATITELLNLTRQKLRLEPIGEINSPLALLIFIRNSLQPEEWLLVGAVAWFLIFILLIMYKSLGKNLVCSGSGVLALLVVVAIVSYITLLQGPYSKKLAIVVGNNGATLRTLPSTLGSEEGVIPVGYEVKIIDKRNDYDLIKVGNIEGWTKSSSIETISY